MSGFKLQTMKNFLAGNNIYETSTALQGTNKENTMLLPMNFDGEIKPLSAGVYAARIIAAEGRVGKTSGNPYINWQLETFGSPEVNGKRVFHMTPTSGGWVTKLAELHKAATGEDIDKKAKQYDPEMLVGKEVTITLTTREYQGKDQLEVKAVAPYKQ